MKVVRPNRKLFSMMDLLGQMETNVINGPCNKIKIPLEAIFSIGTIEAVATQMGFEPRSPY